MRPAGSEIGSMPSHDRAAELIDGARTRSVPEPQTAAISSEQSVDCWMARRCGEQPFPKERHSRMAAANATTNERPFVETVSPGARPSKGIDRSGSVSDRDGGAE
jgi:hypothetical protein